MPSNTPRLIRYPNGFELLFVPCRTAPVLALELWVRAGSACETNSEAGIAHLIEHMLFKGTARRPSGAIAREVEAVGGDINAFTSCDHTVYTVALASRFAELGLDILEDAVFHSIFDSKEIESEKRVVLEEIRRSLDLPHHCLSQLLFSQAYRNHPYGRPVIGTEETVASFNRESCLTFLNRWYSPRSMTLVAAGSADPGRLAERVRRAFGTRESPRAPARRRREPAPRRRGFRARFESRDAAETYFDLAFPGPCATHPDVPAVDLLMAILGQGDASRLQHRVKLDRNLVRAVGAGAYLPAEAGLLTVGGVVEPSLLPEAYDAICEEIFRFCDEPVGERELERAKENLEADFVYQKETVQGQAQKAGFFHVILGDASRERDYVESLRCTDPLRIRAAARRYFRNDEAVLAVVHPGAEPPPWTEDEAGRVTASIASALRRRPASGRRRRALHHFALPGGARLLIKVNPDVPIVALRAAWLGGSRREPADQAGAFHLLADCLTRGTRSRSVFDIAHETDAMGGQIEGFAGRNSFGLKGEFLSKYLEDGLDLFSEILCHPSFPEEEVEKARQDALGALRLRRDNPAALAFRLFEETFYPDHPYGRDILGTPEALGRLCAQDLQRLFRAAGRPETLVIAVAGDVDASLIEQFFNHAAEHLAPSGELPPPPPALIQPPGPTLCVHGSATEQTHVVVGFPGTTVSDPDRYALRLANGVLAGQGGRLFRRLRDDLGLAYTVSTACIEGLDPGYVAAYAATAPRNADRARETLLEEFERLAAGDVSRQDLEEAKHKLVGGFEIALQENAFQASQLALDELYGAGHATLQMYARALLSVPLGEVVGAAQRHFQGTSSVSVILGPESP